MHASIVVLSALVAVTAGQFIYSPASWAYPTHSITGQPLDTPEVAVAKARHAVQWNHEAARTAPHVVAPIVAAPAAVYLRKRREAPAPETPETHAQENAETPKDKRQILSMAYGYSPLAYSAYPAYSAYSYSAYPYATSAAYLLRKRRDVSSEETKAPETNDNNKEKRQVILPYSMWSPSLAYSAYSPYAAIPYSSYSYATSPFLFRKRRDTSAASEEQVAAEPSENREKRQFFLPYAGYAAPAVIPYSGFHASVYRSPIAYYG